MCSCTDRLTRIHTDAYRHKQTYKNSQIYIAICACSGQCVCNHHESVSRITVVSREAKKKQHACASSSPRDHYSELFRLSLFHGTARHGTAYSGHFNTLFSGTEQLFNISLYVNSSCLGLSNDIHSY